MCCAGSRLFVQESIAEPAIEKLKRRMATLRVGDPLDKNTDVGAINSRAQLEKIEELVAAGREPRAPSSTSRRAGCPRRATGSRRPCSRTSRRATGSRRRRSSGRCSRCSRSARRTRRSRRRTTRRTGSRPGVWTEKGSRILWMAERLRAGVVWANTYNRFDPASPFGGYRESGFGREGGLHGLAPYLDGGVVSLEIRRAGACGRGGARRARPRDVDGALEPGAAARRRAAVLRRADEPGGRARRGRGRRGRRLRQARPREPARLERPRASRSTGSRVDPRSGRRGVGRALIDAALAEARGARRPPPDAARPRPERGGAPALRVGRLRRRGRAQRGEFFLDGQLRRRRADGARPDVSRLVSRRPARASPSRAPRTRGGRRRTRASPDSSGSIVSAAVSASSSTSSPQNQHGSGAGTGSAAPIVNRACIAFSAADGSWRRKTPIARGG